MDRASYRKAPSESAGKRSGYREPDDDVSQHGVGNKNAPIRGGSESGLDTHPAEARNSRVRDEHRRPAHISHGSAARLPPAASQTQREIIERDDDSIHCSSLERSPTYETCGTTNLYVDERETHGSHHGPARVIKDGMSSLEMIGEQS